VDGCGCGCGCGGALGAAGSGGVGDAGAGGTEGEAGREGLDGSELTASGARRARLAGALSAASAAAAAAFLLGVRSCASPAPLVVACGLFLAWGCGRMGHRRVGEGTTASKLWLEPHPLRVLSLPSDG
jgi:hypothetical protein